MDSFKTLKTKSGIKTIVVKRPKNPNRVQLHLVYGIGSDLEKGSNLEASHFLEHLFVSLTSTKYPSSKQNRELFSGNGITYTASAGTKTTEYEFGIDRNQTDLFFDILVHGIFDFKVDKEIFENEKNSIIEELHELIDGVSYPLETNTDAMIYRGHNRQVSQRRRLENTKKITLRQIESFWLKYYKLPYLVLAIYGSVDIAKITQKIDTLSKGLVSKNGLNRQLDGKSITKIYMDYNLKNESKVLFTRKNDSVSNIKLSWRVDMNIFNKDYYNLYCIDYIMLEDLNSLLLKKLRADYGLIYDIKSDFSFDEFQNSLSFYTFETTVASKKVLKVIQGFMEVIDHLTKNYIKTKSLNKYIHHQQTLVLDRNESLDYRYHLNNYAKFILFDKPLQTISAEDKLYLAVTPASILETAKKVFNTNNLYVSYSNKENVNKRIDTILTSLDF